MEKVASSPYVFDEFFASGKEESISPFLTPSSRLWGKNLPLKTALLSAFLLAAAFTASFFNQASSHLLLTLVYFLAGTPALIGAIDDIKNLDINIDVLMTLSAFLSVLIGSELEGALLLVLFELSGSIEGAVAQKTKSAIVSLNRLSPKIACVLDNEGRFFDRSVKEVGIGAHLLVKAGEIVPLDGLVISGSCFVNLVHLTGESQPISKKEGDEVQAGAYNLDGTLTIKVTRTTSDSTLSRIIQLILEAQSSKPTLQRLLDRFGKWYASSIISLAILFSLTLPFLLTIPYLGPEGSIYRALTFLIAASPCALIIATPTAYLSAISSCAKRGILLKGGIALDAIASCSIVAFDKTGTLTTGKLSCIGMEPLQTFSAECSDQTALSIAASLEQHAVHPIAEAVLDYAKKRGAPLMPIADFKALAGFGLEAAVILNAQKRLVFIGHADFIFSKMSASIKEKFSAIEGRLRLQAQMTTLLLVGETLFAFYFTDTIRKNAKDALEKLKKRGLRLIMLTGDHRVNAENVAKILNVDEVFADLRPEDKLAKVAHFSKEKGLLMVGDGVNDAPALARASVGISMGKIGSATAVDASDIVFLQDDLSLLDWVFKKAHQTLFIVKENLSLALLVILLATTPALLGVVPLWAAVLMHEGGTVLVGLNSLRLLKA
ncbi:MAG: heavy metal translocating P-type ATPase [Anaerolineae bacterium]